MHPRVIMTSKQLFLIIFIIKSDHTINESSKNLAFISKNQFNKGRRAIDRCIKERILADFLSQNRAESVKLTEETYGTVPHTTRR